MTSILLLSHSNKLANGLKELLSQMASSTQIEVSGGTEDGELGSNFDEIQNKMTSLAKQGNLVVFFDAGSSMMNSQMVYESLEDGLKEKVIIADMPIVEGSIEVSVKIETGTDFEEIKEYISNNKYGKLS